MANITKEERERRKAEEAVQLAAQNPRLPVSPVVDDAPEPKTDAATALPPGTPGTVDPLPYIPPPVVSHEQPIVMFPVRILRGYYPLDGSKKLEPDTEVELPISEARHLIESGIAVRADELPLP
jgi:hypothetical protein